MSLARSGLIVSLCSAANMMMNVVAQLVIAHHFGAGPGLDAFLLAQMLPLYIQTLIIPSITVATTPTIIAEQTMHGALRSSQLTASLAKRLLVGMSIIALTIALTPTQTIHIAAAGASPTLQSDAARALPWLAAALVPQALGSFYVGVQNIHGNFLVPTLSTGIGMMANILCIQLINTPSPTDKLAIAYAFGAFMQFSVCAMLPMIRTARLKHPDIRAASKKILRSIWPLIFFGLISRAMPLMERSIATDLPSGSISHLSYASKIANILDTLIGFSLATVLLPELAKLASQNNIDALAKTYRKALALATNIAAPIGLLCIASAKEIVELLLQRGNFTAEDTRETAALLPLYVLGVLFSILGTVIGRFLYAQGKTLAFNIAGALVGLLYPICAIWLKPSMGLMALALAQAICSATGVLLGFGLVAKQTNPIDLAFLRSCLLALITFAIVTYYPAPTPQAHSIVKIMVQSLYCIAVYGMTWAISAPAFQDRK